MLTFAYYILKIIICSGILYGYYLIALRDKVFHKWNRFYLLAAIILSLTVPLIKINIWQKADEHKTQAEQLLQVVSTGDEFVFNYTRDNEYFHLTTTNICLFIYTIISAFLLLFLISSLLKINKLKRNSRQTIVEGINFINTNAKGTPFSFFKNIFWNDKIDLNSSTGKQIFKHEVAHVEEGHSYDKIFINITLIFFWINPFFWLIRKELNMIHEFIADKKALEDSDTAAFAAMILQATYPQQQFTITNNFFYSPLKRRLAMLTKNQNPKINYVSRMLVLPLAAVVFFAFTLKMKTISSANYFSGKKINVVIDAGHGGDDKGINVNNINEKDIVLSIAKEIRDLNKNENINIILSREDDKTMNVKDRIKFAEANKADLFISIHVDFSTDIKTYSGLNVLIPKSDNPYLKESRLLGSVVIKSFESNYTLPVSNELKQRDVSVWVLKANQSPAVLIEAGFLSNKKDLEFLIRKENQRIIARNILDGIEKYTQQDLSLIDKSFDTIPHPNQSVVVSGKITNKTITKTFIANDSIPKKKEGENALIILDGVEIKNSNLNSISPNSIQSITVLKGDQATIKYGSKGKDGVIEITTKKLPEKLYKISYDKITTQDSVPLPGKVFTKSEVEPSFPGGNEAWIRYMTKVFKTNIEELSSEGVTGTCRVRFIVNTDSTVMDVTVLTMAGTKLAQISADAIKKGPKWNPAKQNGYTVAAYKEQPITFAMADN